MSPVDPPPGEDFDPLVLLHSRFRSTAAVAIAAGIAVQELHDDLDELAARITTAAEVPEPPKLTVVPSRH